MWQHFFHNVFILLIFMLILYLIATIAEIFNQCDSTLMSNKWSAGVPRDLEGVRGSIIDRLIVGSELPIGSTVCFAKYKKEYYVP